MVNCPRCNEVSDFDEEQGSWYTAYCELCGDTYCAMCPQSPDHFPAWCSDVLLWNQANHNRTNEYNEAMNIVRDLIQQRYNMYGYRDAIDHLIFDHHEHMSYAVEEMQKILRILANTRVIAFVRPNLLLLNALEFTNLENAFVGLRDQFDLDLADGGPFNLAHERWAACNAVVQLLSLLQKRHDGDFNHVVHIPPRLPREVNFTQSMSRTEREWTISAFRPPPPPPPID